MKNKITRIFVSILIGLILFFMLFKNMNSLETKVEYKEVAIVTVNVETGHKFVDTDVKIVSRVIDDESLYFQNKDEIVGKYANDRIYKDEMIRTENVKQVKKIENTEVLKDYRQVRILTDVYASAGVGKGDRVDLVYVNKDMMTNELIGKIVCKNVEVKNVLNQFGNSLEGIIPDEYNQTELIPSFLEFWLPQDKAVEIQTLQGITNDVLFKIIKFTEYSRDVDTLPTIKKQKEIIYGDQNNEMNEEVAGEN